MVSRCNELHHSAISSSDAYIASQSNSNCDDNPCAISSSGNFTADYAAGNLRTFSCCLSSSNFLTADALVTIRTVEEDLA